jgi:hypothetical protein
MLLSRSSVFWRRPIVSVKRVISLYAAWRRSLVCATLSACLQSTPRSKKRSIFDGPNGQLHPIEYELLMFIFFQREQGINVKHTLVCPKASLMLPNTFGAKGYKAHIKVVMRFMRKHNYMYRNKTNEATRAPQEVSDKAREFLDFTRPLLLGPHRDRRWIFNMDQMPLHFSYHSSRTLEKRGAKTIHIHKTGNRTKRAMREFTIMAAGNFLTPMIIFKGMPRGRITQNELPKLDPTSIYACQEAAWMDERCMLIWVEQILGPYLVVNPPPPGIQPVILLDAYHCQMMASVVNRISDLGIEVIHIPGGCTGLCQLLEVRVNKLFKQRFHHLWEEWMMEMLDRDGANREATREEVAEWTASVYWDMVGSKILKNAWRKTGFDWFEGVGNDHNNDNADGDGDGDNDGNGDYDEEDDDANVNFVFDDGEGNEDDIDEDVAEEGWNIVDEGGAY